MTSPRITAPRPPGWSDEQLRQLDADWDEAMAGFDLKAWLERDIVPMFGPGRILHPDGTYEEVG